MTTQFILTFISFPCTPQMHHAAPDDDDDDDEEVDVKNRFVDYV